MKKIILIIAILALAVGQGWGAEETCTGDCFFGCSWEDGSDAQNTGATHVFDSSSGTPTRATPSEAFLGSYALQLSDGGVEWVQDANGGSQWGKSIVYARMAFRFTGESLGSGDYAVFFNLANSSAVPTNLLVKILDTSGTISINVAKQSQANTWADVGTGQTITQDTWYQIEVYYAQELGGGEGEVGWRLWNKAGSELYTTVWDSPVSNDRTADVDNIRVGTYNSSRDDVAVEVDALLVSDAAIGAGTASGGMDCGSTIYVDDDLGADCTDDYSISGRACSGSDGCAYQTITDALASGLVADDTIEIRAGTYTENLTMPDIDGSVGQPITIRNYNGESVTLAASTGQAIVGATSLTYITISGLTITATYNSDQKVIELEGPYNTCLGDADCGDPDIYGVKNVILEDLTVQGGLYMLGSNNLIDSCTFDGNDQWTQGIWTLFANSHDNIFRDNTIYDFTVRGIWIMQTGSGETTYSALIEGNTIYGIGDLGIDLDGYGDTEGVQYGIIQDNVIYDMGSESAIELENGYYCTVTRNEIYDSKNAINIVTYEDSESGHDKEHRDDDMHSVISFNIIHDLTITSGDGAQHAIKVNGSEYISIIGNTIYNIQGDADYASAIGLVSYGGYANDNAVVKNNLISEWNVGDYAIWYQNDGSGYDFDNNIFFDSGQADTHYTNTDTTAYTLVEFQAAETMEINSSNVDPLMVNPGSDDFTLKQGSPACFGGTEISGYNTRLDPTSSWPDDVRTRGGTQSNGTYECNRGAAGM